MQILSKITSSLEKCFLTDPIGKFPEIREISMLENEHLSLQLVTAGYPDTTDRLTFRAKLRLRITGDAAPFVTVRVVEQAMRATRTQITCLMSRDFTPTCSARSITAATAYRWCWDSSAPTGSTWSRTEGSPRDFTP